MTLAVAGADYDFSQSLPSSGDPVAFPNIDFGAGANAGLVLIAHRDRTETMPDAVTHGTTPVALTNVGGPWTLGNLIVSLWAIENPESGPQDLTVDPPPNGVGSSYAVVAVAGIVDAHETTPFGSPATNSGSDADGNTLTELTKASAEGRLVVFFHFCYNPNDSSVGTTPSGYTEDALCPNLPFGGGISIGHAAGAASVVTSCQWNDTGGASNWLVVGIDALPAEAGGTPTVTEHYQLRLKRRRAA